MKLPVSKGINKPGKVRTFRLLGIFGLLGLLLIMSGVVTIAQQGKKGPVPGRVDVIEVRPDSTAPGITDDGTYYLDGSPELEHAECLRFWSGVTNIGDRRGGVDFRTFFRFACPEPVPSPSTWRFLNIHFGDDGNPGLDLDSNGVNENPEHIFAWISAEDLWTLTPGSILTVGFSIRDPSHDGSPQVVGDIEDRQAWRIDYLDTRVYCDDADSSASCSVYPHVRIVSGSQAQVCQTTVVKGNKVRCLATHLPNDGLLSMPFELRFERCPNGC